MMPALSLTPDAALIIKARSRGPGCWAAAAALRGLSWHKLCLPVLIRKSVHGLTCNPLDCPFLAAWSKEHAVDLLQS